MTAIVLALILQSDLIEKLDDDNWRTRDTASRQLFEMGERAFPALEGALAHSSLEVRSRAWNILRRSAPYRTRAARLHPDYEKAASLWNAIINAVIHKKPIPEKVWQSLPQREYIEREKIRPISNLPHTAGWILKRMIETAERWLPELAGRVGIEGGKQVSVQIAKEMLRDSPRPDLPVLLRKFNADADTFEEVFGTLLTSRRDYCFIYYGKEDWETFIAILVEIRRRSGAKPVFIPLTRTGALLRVSRGPWIRGIAARLKRKPDKIRNLMKQLEDIIKHERVSSAGGGHLITVYNRLYALDRALRNVGAGEEVPDCCRGWVGALPDAEAALMRRILPVYHHTWMHDWKDGSVRSELLRAVVRIAAR